MTHAKKNPAGAGEISEKGKANTKGNGKIVPFRPKAGKFRKQEQGKESVGSKKILDQIEIPFPAIITDGIDGIGRNDPGCCVIGGQSHTIGFGFVAGCSTDCANKKREEAIATADH